MAAVSIAVLIAVNIFYLQENAKGETDPKLTTTMNTFEIINTESHLPKLNIALSHLPSGGSSNDYPILFLHGSSFPSALSFGFKMSGESWMDDLSHKGFDVFALDFLGYGNSDRYPEMLTNSMGGRPLGRASEVYQDVDKAVNLIIEKTKKNKVYLIGHSWGGSVAALYASKHPDKVAKLVMFAAITARNSNAEGEILSDSFETMTPSQRIEAMKRLTPKGKDCRLENEVLETWGDIWLRSDPLSEKFHSEYVRFPAGPSQDIEDLEHNKPYYDPAEIKVPVLIVRGEWDKYPSYDDAQILFTNLENAPLKKYVVIERGTHVMHLEKSRHQLYDEVSRFLQAERTLGKTNKHALAVIFEVIPAEGRKQEYLDIAARLKPELEKIKGFISIERFQSIYHPEKILSLSFWENEEAIKKWRNLERHRQAQAKGRSYVFEDYHLRVSQVIRDYGMFDREQAPNDSREIHQ